MREINTSQLTTAVAALCQKAAVQLPKDVKAALEKAQKEESWPPAQSVLNILQQNISCAQTTGLPLCQDTGVACVFVQLGQQVALTGGDFNAAINQGVRSGYSNGWLRKSLVRDPLCRSNTGDNTPAFIDVSIVEGSNIKITLLPKGFGSENASRIAMLNPAEGEEGVRNFILQTVLQAGANPCPPVVLGVGVGGSFSTAPAAAKQALLRPIGSLHPNPFYAKMEEELLLKINQSGIGPAGYGGKTTALALHIVAMPTHIAGLPVAVNVSCHALRRASVVI